MLCNCIIFFYYVHLFPDGQNLLYYHTVAFDIQWKCKIVILNSITVMADCPHTIGVEFGTRYIYYFYS